MAGLLERPVRQAVLTLAPGQRADLLVDLSGIAAGTSIHLESEAFPEADAGVVGMMGMGRGMGMGMRGMAAGTSAANGAALRVMTLRSNGRKGVAFAMPERLSTLDATWAVAAGAKVRQVPIVFQRMEWLLGGRTFEMAQVAPEETVAAGSTQVWEFMNLANGMGMQAAHPIHVHGRQFRVLSRSGGAGNALRAGPGRRRVAGRGAGAAGRDRARADDVHAPPGPVSLPLPHPRARGHGHDAQLPSGLI